MKDESLCKFSAFTRYFILAIASFCALSALSANSLAADKPHLISAYAGEQNRSIKSLSDDDIQQLMEGRGWGLAKAAELNGIPGPAHLLEMKKAISLTDTQIEKIQQLYNDMKQQAQRLGKELIKLESELNQSFANKTINAKDLLEKLTAIEKVRRDLRYVHLATHLETPSILNPVQIARYNELRGYSNDDPCSHVPPEHDRDMWFKHNGCK